MINITQGAILIPIFGAILGIFFRKSPKALQTCFLSATLLTLVPLLLNPQSAEPGARWLTLLIALTGGICVLARHLRPRPSFDLFEILILMGLGFGFLFTPEPLSLIFLITIFALLLFMQLRVGGGLSDPETRWVIGLNGFAILALSTVSLFSAQMQNILYALTYATLLPLFPLHGAYAVFLKRLPGTLPAFIATFLPTLGLQGLIIHIPMLPSEIKDLLLIFAILGIVIGTLRSLAQIRVPHVLSQMALVFWSILWCYLLRSEQPSSTVLVFFSASALTLCGLFLTSHGLTARYGNFIIDQFGGLGSAMPRFSVLFVLLSMAAMGLPLFGVFSGFIRMAFSTSEGLSWALSFSLLAWIFAAWRFPALMEGLLFGKSNPQWIYSDLSRRETTALILILTILFILGVAPDFLIRPALTSNLSSEHIKLAIEAIS